MCRYNENMCIIYVLITTSSISVSSTGIMTTNEPKIFSNFQNLTLRLSDNDDIFYVLECLFEKSKHLADLKHVWINLVVSHLQQLCIRRKIRHLDDIKKSSKNFTLFCQKDYLWSEPFKCLKHKNEYAFIPNLTLTLFARNFTLNHKKFTKFLKKFNSKFKNLCRIYECEPSFFLKSKICSRLNLLLRKRKFGQLSISNLKKSDGILEHTNDFDFRKSCVAIKDQFCHRSQKKYWLILEYDNKTTFFVYFLPHFNMSCINKSQINYRFKREMIHKYYYLPLELDRILHNSGDCYNINNVYLLKNNKTWMCIIIGSFTKENKIVYKYCLQKFRFLNFYKTDSIIVMILDIPVNRFNWRSRFQNGKTLAMFLLQPNGLRIIYNVLLTLGLNIDSSIVKSVRWYKKDSNRRFRLLKKRNAVSYDDQRQKISFGYVHSDSKTINLTVQQSNANSSNLPSNLRIFWNRNRSQNPSFWKVNFDIRWDHPELPEIRQDLGYSLQIKINSANISIQEKLDYYINRWKTVIYLPDNILELKNMNAIIKLKYSNGKNSLPNYSLVKNISLKRDNAVPIITMVQTFGTVLSYDIDNHDVSVLSSIPPNPSDIESSSTLEDTHMEFDAGQNSVLHVLSGQTWMTLLTNFYRIEKTKIGRRIPVTILTVTAGPILSMCVDWFGRYVYWVEILNNRSVILRYHLDDVIVSSHLNTIRVNGQVVHRVEQSGDITKLNFDHRQNEIIYQFKASRCKALCRNNIHHEIDRFPIRKIKINAFERKFVAGHFHESIIPKNCNLLTISTVWHEIKEFVKFPDQNRYLLLSQKQIFILLPSDCQLTPIMSQIETQNKPKYIPFKSGQFIQHLTIAPSLHSSSLFAYDGKSNFKIIWFDPRDSGRIINGFISWLPQQNIYLINKIFKGPKMFIQDKLQSLVWFGKNQPFEPDIRLRMCLLPRWNSLKIRLLHLTQSSITIQIPGISKLECHHNGPVPPTIYSVKLLHYQIEPKTKIFRRFPSEKPFVFQLDDLQASTVYTINVTIFNYYGYYPKQWLEISNIMTMNQPPIISVHVINPKKLLVLLNETSNQTNAENIVMYQTESLTRTKQYSKVISNSKRNRKVQRLILNHLNENTKYKIWMTTQLKNKTAIINSKPVFVKMFRNPKLPKQINRTASSIALSWTAQDECYHQLILSPRNSDSLMKIKVPQKPKVSWPGETYSYVINNLKPLTEYIVQVHVLYGVSKIFNLNSLENKANICWAESQLHLLDDDTRFMTSNFFYKENDLLEHAKICAESISSTPYIWPKNNSYTITTYPYYPQTPSSPYVLYKKEINDFVIAWTSTDKTVTEFQVQCKTLNLDEMENERNIDSEWKVIYRGRGMFSKLDFNNIRIDPNMSMVFRVKALNAIGWGNFSSLSKKMSVSELLINHFKFTKTKTAMAILFSISSITKNTIFGVILTITFLLFILKRLVYNFILKKRKTFKPDELDIEMLTNKKCGNQHSHNHTVSNPIYDFKQDTELKQIPKVDKSSIEIVQFIGSGAFGIIYEASLNGDIEIQESIDPDTKKPKNVAIKILSKAACNQSKEDILNEAKTMFMFNHMNVVRLFGICVDFENTILIMEYMEAGDLLAFLRLIRSNYECVQKDGNLWELLKMCLDVSQGCQYLAEKLFIHGDIAARNCLVSCRNPNNRIVKISDFGLSRNINGKKYYRKSGPSFLPIRWMAPESILDGIFTSMTDVWSLGILFWEVLSLGRVPYGEKSNFEIITYISNGGQPEQPKLCPQFFVSLMNQCWKTKPEHRPSAEDCVDFIKLLLNQKDTLPDVRHQK